MTFMRPFRDRQSMSAIREPILFDTDWDNDDESSFSGSGTRAFHESIMPQAPPSPPRHLHSGQSSPSSTIKLIEIVSTKISCTDSSNLFQQSLSTNTTIIMKNSNDSDDDEYDVECHGTPEKKNKIQKTVTPPSTTAKRKKLLHAPSRLRTVSFHEQVVTATHHIPRIQAKDSQTFFYKPRDFQRFRRDWKQNQILETTEGTSNSNSSGSEDDEEGDVDLVQNPLDSAYCMDVVCHLERIGKEKFMAGSYSQALEAFSHSLRLQTETSIPIDQLVTSSTIHSIADIYAKLGRWTRDLEMYFAALEILDQMMELSSKTSTSNGNENEVQEWCRVLNRKIATVQNYLARISASATSDNNDTSSLSSEDDSEVVCL
mmetsp:Transcript_17821/g.25081  ORF Transcript_17821/g.25081 Transcript_17821/m.25081 type:complete len:373 (+) Transcript_17821:135-1253(+)